MKNITDIEQNDRRVRTSRADISRCAAGELALRGRRELPQEHVSVRTGLAATTRSRSSTSRPIGLFAANRQANGSIDVSEIYAEALIPLPKDLPFWELSLELGGRYSDYSTDGGRRHLQGAVELGSSTRLRESCAAATSARTARRTPPSCSSAKRRPSSASPAATRASAAESQDPGLALNLGQRPDQPESGAGPAAVLGAHQRAGVALRPEPGHVLGLRAFFPLELEAKVGNPTLKSRRRRPTRSALC